MSWLRNAMNKAVEVGNKNNLTRTVKNYADTVVHQAGQAVAEGAKIFQDRIGVRNFKSVNQTIRRLEDAAISCRGPERVMLLRRWLAVLKEVDKIYGLLSEDKEKMNEQLDAFDEAKDGPRKPSMVLYYDTDSGGEPLNFSDVFLQSQALEAMTVSMILEAPNEDEISLLLEMFGLCLTGGKEVHNAITSSIQDLATAVSKYRDEVLIFVSASLHGASFGLLEYLSLNLITERKILPNDAPCTDALTNIRVKREELLQFAQTAITGLKINADIERMDAETSDLKKRLEGMKALQKSPDEGIEQTSEKTTKATIEDLKEALAQIRVCSRLEGLLLKKKLLSYGDSPEIHAQKVDKLKVLSESLSNSTIKAEKRIADHRSQKEEALKVRVVKASEAIEKEKEIGAEISELVKQRDHLEAELKKVNISLAAAEARLRNAQEERDQFDVANDQIVEHLKTKEDELLKSIAACRAESNVLGTWINFLEDTWALQCSHTEMKDKQVSEELEKHEDYFVNLAISLLSAYKKELGPSISRIGKFVENLENLREGSEIASGGSDEDSKELNPRKHLEEEYLDYEAKIITTFSVVDKMKEQFYAQRRTSSRKDDPKVKELFDDIEKLRQEFESVERPNLELENLSPKAGTSSNEMSPKSPSSPPMQGTTTQKPDISEHREKPVHKTERALDPEAELAKLESEFGKVGQDYSGEEIGDWEFDELEREFKTGDSAPSK